MKLIEVEEITKPIIVKIPFKVDLELKIIIEKVSKTLIKPKKEYIIIDKFLGNNLIRNEYRYGAK